MRWTTSLLAAFAIAGSAIAAADVLTPQLADAFEKKIVLVQNNAGVAQNSTGVNSGKTVATAFTQAETNSYLKYKAGDLLPVGLMQPELTMIGAGKVSGKAIVDLDIVRQKQGSGGWFDPTSYLTGKLPVTASGKIVTWDGKGKFELESAEVSGVPIPKTFLAQMVNFFTRTADNPRGSSIDDIFELPSDIRRIDVDANRFTVHQ